MSIFKTLCFFWMAAILPATLMAQECGTQPTPEQIKFLTETREARQAFDIHEVSEERFGPGIHWIPLQFHECLNSSTAWPYLTHYETTNWMGQLNTLFLPYRIQFYECGARDTFINATLFNFDSSEEPLLAPYEIPGVLNVYVFGTVTSSGQSVGGYSYLPPSVDRVILNRSGGNLYNAKVFLHEIGHYFGLYHTHGKTNNGTTDELVNGSNCLTGGDDVCDTPADPNLSGRNSNCLYTGTVLDANGQPFAPNVGNHMSYAAQSCRNHFSVGQMNRMVYTALNDRAYLLGCAHPSGCENPITQLPTVFDFESGLDGWINQSYEGYGPFVNFLHATGPIAPTTTGPEQAVSGTGYVYLDGTTAGVNGANACIISPCIDLRGQVAPKMTMKYHAFGAGIGSFAAQVSMDGGQNYVGIAPSNFLFQIDGEQGNAWQTITCDLSPFKTAAALQVRILATGALEGDLAFDSIAIYNDPQNACNLSIAANSTDISCYGSTNGSIVLTPSGNYTAPVSYVWSNGATSSNLTGLAAGLYTVTATSANGCSVVVTLPILSPNYLYASTTQTNVTIYGQTTGSATVQAVGGRRPYAYLWSNGATTQVAGGLGAGTYTVTVSDANGCTVLRTVTITQPAIICASYFYGLPWVSSIEQNLGIFVQETNDNFNWTRQSGSTPTSQTGPDQAWNGGYYWYTKASGGNAPNKTASLKTTQCLTLTSLNNPVFEFYYHMYGNQMGTLSVEISVDNEATWTTVWTKTGNQGNQWFKGSVSLMPWRTDHTKIRIKGVTGSGSRSDMAIDALYIGEAGSNFLSPEATIADAPEMVVYPNPSTGWFELRMADGQVCEKVDICNATGQLIWSETTSSTLLTFDLAGQASGYYYLRVYAGESVQVLKLMLVR